MLAKLKILLHKIVLLDDYDYKGLKLSAKENALHASVHFLFPFSISLLFDLAGAPTFAKLVFGLCFGIYTLYRELFVETWQTAFKTRSDILTKCAGLLGLLL